MSTTTSATLDAARRVASALPNAAAMERDPEVAPRRHERDADVGLAGAPLVVVDDHVGGVARRRPQRAHGARRLGVHAHLEAARGPEDGPALPEHVRGAQRPHRVHDVVGELGLRAARAPSSHANDAEGSVVAVRVGLAGIGDVVRDGRAATAGGAMVVERW